MKPVVMFDYREQLDTLREELMAAVTRVLDSGTLILGPEVDTLEADLGRFCGARHVIS